jgi:hypothetical protein
LENEPCYQVAGYDEEHVDADEPAPYQRKLGVEQENKNYSNGSQTIDRR